MFVLSSDLDVETFLLVLITVIIYDFYKLVEAYLSATPAILEGKIAFVFYLFCFSGLK